MSIKLSFCIPTYNFAKFIPETLDSILPQLNESVEIVILDGASTDNTEEVVRYYQTKSPQIRYFREPQKGGIDKDIHLSIEKARGEYCWLFSSDDVLIQGAIKKVLEEIQEGHDVYLSNFTICTLNIDETMEEHSILNRIGPQLYNLSNKDEREEYFKQAVATPAFFSFMGSLIIKRSRWLETSIESHFFGSCWAHAVRIFRMIPQGLQVKYMADSFLRKRSFNDSFMDRGFIHRIAIAIDGYTSIGSTIFGENSTEMFHIRRTLKKEFPLGTFLIGKKETINPIQRLKLKRLIKKTYQDEARRKVLYSFVVLFVPNWIVPFLVYLHRGKKILLSKIKSYR